MRKTIKRAVVIGTALAVTTGAGAAYAAWLATGTGTATAKATSSQQLTTSTVTITGDLYPGASGDVTLKINNPNRFPVRLTDIATTGPVTASSPTCVTTGVTVTVPATVPSTLIGAEGSATVVLAGAATMSNASDSGCQGATFTVPVSITGQSSAS